MEKLPLKVAQEEKAHATKKKRMKSIISELQKAIEERDKKSQIEGRWKGASSPQRDSTHSQNENKKDSLDLVEVLRAKEAILHSALELQDRASAKETLLKECEKSRRNF